MKLGQVEAARFAVLRFDGGRTAENEKNAIEKLKAWLTEQKLVGNGSPPGGKVGPSKPGTSSPQAIPSCLPGRTKAKLAPHD